MGTVHGGTLTRDAPNDEREIKMASITPKTDAAAEQFRQLRDSGYTGWIDQDGQPVADIDQWITDQQQQP